MTGKDLLIGMNSIDEEVIEEVFNSIEIKLKAATRKRKQNKWPIAVAACLCVAVALGTWSLYRRIFYRTNPSATNYTNNDESRDCAVAPYGEEIYAKLQYENELYIRDYEIVETTVRDNWNYVGTIQASEENGWDFTENFQTNRKEYVGCKLYSNSMQQGELWLEYNGQFLHFLAEKYWASWICHDGKLYLYDDSYYNLKKTIPESYNTKYLPSDAKEIGILRYNSDVLLPETELETNKKDMNGYKAFYSEAEKCLLVAIPRGTYDGATAYWRFIEAEPDLFEKQ